MASKQLVCLGCGRDDFKSQRGLTQHLNANKWCQNPNLNNFFGKVVGLNLQKRLCQSVAQNQSKKTRIAAYFASVAGKENQNTKLSTSNLLPYALDDEVEEADDFLINYESDDEHHENNSNPPDTTIRDDFLKYVESKQSISFNFSKYEANAIRLLKVLRKSNASLVTYDAISEWHLRATGVLHPKQKYADSPAYVSTKVLYKELQIRYDYLEDALTEVKSVTLPHSKAVVNVLINDAKVVMRQLLTDPRITDDDYLFFDNDPHSKPPEDVEFIRDLNTGRAYLHSYQKYIKFPGKQVLLPVLFYIDGANTGLSKAKSLTPVNMSLGIFTRKAREKEHFWKPLGFIPEHIAAVLRGKREFLDSNHMDATAYAKDTDPDGGQELDDSVEKAQDLHTMLDVIWESYIELQKTGFMWDLFYRNTRYNDIEFVLFTPFLKLDTDEAEKLCGKFTCRSGKVKCLCRYCECPTDQTDKPFEKYPLKTMEKIQRLIDRNDNVALKQISQQNIQNACYKLRFGAHSEQGVHGLCPMDMLHQILLGLFKYARAIFLTNLEVKTLV